MASRELERLRREVEAEKAALEAEVEACTFCFIDDTHVPQARFLRDRSKRKVVFTTRRSGKTYGAADYLLDGAAQQPNAASLYISISRDSAKRNFWIPCLKPAARAAGLTIVPAGPRPLAYGEARANETDLSLTLWNGHIIYILGMDASEDERRKLLGGKYFRVVVDEAQDFIHADLTKMVDANIGYALADYTLIEGGGELVLCGTPSDMQFGLFFELTRDVDSQEACTFTVKGWSGHRWTTYDNPHMRAQWEAELARMLAANPLVEETPTFQQHYRGRWVIDPTNLVYRYIPDRADWDGVLPRNVSGDGWHLVKGVDLGWGATAFTWLTYHDNLRPLFILESWRAAEMDVTATAKEIQRYERLCEEMGGELETTQIDGANKQAVEEMRARHGVSVTAAEKTDKFDFIRLLNDDLIQGYIKVNVALKSFTPSDGVPRPSPCSDLVGEWKKLVKDVRKLAIGKMEEQRGLSNHNCDSTLYGWRYCYSYLSTPTKERAQPGSPEARDEQEQEMLEHAMAQVAQQRAEQDTELGEIMRYLN